MPHDWPPGKFRLFLSHLSSSHTYVSQVAGWLERAEVSAFVAHKDIMPSSEWQAEIESALATADALVAFLHPDFRMSQWCDQEVGYVLGRNRLVLSVRLGADPHGFLGKYQGIPGVGRSEKEVADGIVQALQAHEGTSREMARAVANGLHTIGWDHVRALTKLAQQIALGGNQAGLRLQSAVATNHDIETEHGGAMQKLDAIATAWLAQPD